MDVAGGQQNIKILQSFDLKKEDLALHILYCSEDTSSNSITSKSINNIIGKEDAVDKQGAASNIVIVEASKLPHLPFPDHSFDLALCSHFLFIDSDKLNEKFHIEALMELTRVASEVRVYPLMDKQGRPSVHLGPILKTMQEKGLGVELKHVAIDNTEKGNALLRIWNQSCDIGVARSPQ